MNVAGLARAAGVSPHTIRYYSGIGLLRARRRPGTHYRVFEEADVRRLAFIRSARRLGFSLKEIGTILETSQHGRTPCPVVRTIMQRRIPVAARALSAMASMQRRMEAAMRMWRRMPDGVPDGDSICRLIEAAEERIP